jgi:DMSO reductase family type II enzyme chaperone
MSAEVAGLLARASVYQALGLGYAYPSADQREGLRALIEHTRPWTDTLGDRWAGLLAAVAQASTDADQDEVEEDFNRLFSGVVECPPHETAYEPDIFRRQRALADLAGFYKAFGFEIDQASRWQPDHLGVELEFASTLLQRQALAEEAGWDEQASVCGDALRAFLFDHLGRWHAGFGHRLARTAATEVYGRLADATHGWIQSELERFGLSPQPLADRPRVAPDDDVTPSCGICPLSSGATG